MTEKGGPAVDLAGERRIRLALDDLRGMMDVDQRLAARTAAVLRGDLDAPDLEERTMTNETQIAIRVPGDVPGRADALAERMKDAPEYRAWNLTRSGVMRIALLRGLEALEAEHGKGGKRRG